MRSEEPERLLQGHQPNQPTGEDEMKNGKSLVELAQDIESYDRSTDLEQIGGNILD